MKYVFFGCDPIGKSVIWEKGGFMSMSGSLPIIVSNELLDLLNDWNEQMGILVRTPERFHPTELIAAKSKLNEQGQSLAERIEAEHCGDVKVRFLKE